MTDLQLMKRDYTCWQIADDTSKYGQNASAQNVAELKALLKHTLLFNVFHQKLVVSDSHLLNNDSLRLLVRNDECVRELIQSDMLGVAVRANNSNQPVDLNDLVEQFKEGKKYRFSPKLGSGDELDFVSKGVGVVPYKLKELAANFEKESLAIFRGAIAKNTLTPKVADKVHNLAQAEKQKCEKEGLVFGLGFFHDVLPAELDAKLKGKHYKTIMELASAPYQTGMSRVLSADPIYAKEHARAFEILRGHQRKTVFRADEFRFKGKLGLAAFTKGIELLTAQDIVNLLDSNEAAALANARNVVSGSDSSVQDLYETLSEYVYRIEECIVDRHSDLRQSSAKGEVKSVGLSVQEWILLTGKSIELASLKFGILGAPSYLLTKLVMDKLEKSKRELQTEAAMKKAMRVNKEKDELQSKFQLEGNEKIDDFKVKQFTTEEENFDEIETIYNA